MTNQPARCRSVVLLFAATVFLSAFLLFQVQPLISKFILPWFGGTPGVWSTCMLFFQVTLFLGYVYAHLTTRFLSQRTQAVLHVALLILAASLLPITPNDSWKPTTDTEPVLRIITLLGMCVGLPYFLLSSTGPLLQRWFASQVPGTSPYRLYALSNIGSLLALVSYPFVFEPVLGSPQQAWLWSVGFGAFAALCAVCAMGIVRGSVQEQVSTSNQTSDSVAGPTLRTSLRWFGLAMTASVMLLATTNQVCLDVATVPFLWIAPLTIYLLSFILCFDSNRWYSRKWYSVLLILSLLFVIRVLTNGAGVSIVLQIITYLSALYLCCMVCHGELAAQKPHPQYLTRFYLLMSAGGAGGGLLVGLIAPMIFSSYWEMHLVLVAALGVGIVVHFRAGHGLDTDTPKPIKMQPGLLVWPAMLLWAVGALVMDINRNEGANLLTSRNFYGVLQVRETDSSNKQPQRELFHGRIRHGSQLLTRGKEDTPTTYYGRTSGSGLAMRLHNADKARHIGVVGMGIGTLAAYGKPGDTMRFYEINPEVIRIAQEQFSFLDAAQAKCELITGDARLSLERESDHDFDVLVLDAFSGDAIPTHLLTREAFELYDRHLASDGVLCLHISNLHFDLRPIVHALATEFDWHAVGIQNDESEDDGTCLSQWVLLSRKPINPEIHAAAEGEFDLERRRVLWTDEFSNLATILRW